MELHMSGRYKGGIGRTIAFSLCGIWAVSAIASMIGVRVNFTASLPEGVYIPDQRAAVVEFCPPQPFGVLAALRGYRYAGRCPDGAMPLIKPVIARPGDRISISQCGIAVNGRFLANTAPLKSDSHGRPIGHWPFGSYVVRPGTVWVASTWSAQSFDSRYYGPIPASSISAHLRLAVPFSIATL